MILSNDVDTISKVPISRACAPHGLRVRLDRLFLARARFGWSKTRHSYSVVVAETSGVAFSKQAEARST